MKKKKQTKKCNDCTSPPLPNKRRCKACTVAHNEREAKRRKARREAGLCTICGEPAAKKGKRVLALCKKHREAYGSGWARQTAKEVNA